MDCNASAFAILVLLYGLEIALCQKPNTPPAATINLKKGSCPSIAGGTPGIPGIPGIPGMQGPRGDRGEQGNRGEPGNAGVTGGAGKKGGKGDSAASGPIPASNWKQCAWLDLEDGTDNGKITNCPFKKLQENTALRVSFQGNMRTMTNNHCSRWYFKFNGKECSGPMTIDAVFVGHFPSGNPNLHYHRSFEGYCENLPRGVVTVELWVGPCRGYPLGEAYTGRRSVSRIMVEEVTRSQ